MEDDRQLVRIICCINEDHSLSIRGGKVVFVVADVIVTRSGFIAEKYLYLSPWYWIKDDRHGTSRKDSEGQPAFALVNYTTGEAIKHCPENNPVSLIPYNSDSVDEVLWTRPKDKEQGSHIRRMDNISPLFTANKHIVHETIQVYLRHLVNNNNSQLWNIVPYAHHRSSQPTTVKIYCETNVSYNLTVCNDAVMLAPANPADKYQHWIKETTHCQHVKDEENRATFALVNKATGKAIKHGFGNKHLVQLAPFNGNCVDVSLLWSEGGDMANGFRRIRMLTNTSLVLDAADLHELHNWALLIVIWKNDHSNQRWKIEEIK